MVSGEWRVVNGEVSGECGEWWVVSDGSGWAQVVQITPVVQVLSLDLISSWWTCTSLLEPDWIPAEGAPPGG